MKAAEAVKQSIKALAAWQFEVKKHGDRSPQAHKAGGKAIEILVKHVEHLKILTEKYNARPLTQQIIIQLDTIKERFSKKEILSMGGDEDYWFYTHEDFLKDLERWDKMPQRLPVSKRAQILYNKLAGLSELEAMNTPDLLDWLSNERRDYIDEKTLRNHLNELKPYGLMNKPRIGYYIRK